MTKQEFEQILKAKSEQHNMEQCPEDIKKDMWVKSKDMTTDQFKESLDHFFEQFINKYALPDNTEEFMEEFHKFKKKLMVLIKEMLSRGAGQLVLKELAEAFGSKLDFEMISQDDLEAMFKEAEKKSKERKQKAEDKCPDAITPDILKILKGDK